MELLELNHIARVALHGIPSVGPELPCLLAHGAWRAAEVCEGVAARMLGQLVLGAQQTTLAARVRPPAQPAGRHHRHVPQATGRTAV